MNRNAARALASDAFRQVLDNWVFRILAVLTLIPILLTFLIGLREDEVQFLFGLKSWSYAGLFRTFGVHALPSDPQGSVIEILLALTFEFLAGDLGMLLALAATAFFVPRLLEKGAAELYFHKPVSRAQLLCSRYFAGLVFVALVSGVLVVGMYLGLLLVSGHNDPGILLAALQLVYVFALVHAFSTLAGVVTRSTVASILLASFFFLFNGCIHQSWIVVQRNERGPALELRDMEASEEVADDAPQATDGNGGGDEDRAAPSSAWRVLRATLDTLHFVLPKTSDAAPIARKLRRALERPEYRDEDSLVTLFRLPPGVERLGQEELARLDPGEALRAALGEVRFAAASPESGARLSLWRRAASSSETRIGARVKVREETATQAAQELERRLEAAGVAGLSRESTRFGSDAGGRELSGSLLRWQEGPADGGRARRAYVFKGSRSESIHVALVDLAQPSTSELADEASRELTADLGLDVASLEEWYPSQLGLVAPLRFNIPFSIASSLAFAAAVLALACWRLARIAF